MTGLTDRLALAADDRGVSEVIGSILVFGLLVAMLTLVQTQLIPQANEEVEANHDQAVEQDMTRLHSSITRASATGVDESVSVSLGTLYPPRLLFINPPPASGSLRTGTSGSIVLTNIEATNAETRDRIGGPQPYNPSATTTLVYTPNYNRMRNPGQLVFDNGVLAERFDGATTIKTPGNLVSGNQIRLTAIESDVSTTAAQPTSVSVNTISAPAQGITVRDTGSQPTLAIPTGLSQSQWEEILADELVPAQGGSGHITDIQVTNGILRLTFETGVTYELRVAKIGVNDRGQAPPSYLTTADAVSKPVGVSVTQGGAETLTVEVRDEMNNPVAGVTVTATISNPSVGTLDNGVTTGSTVPITTDADGKATVEVQGTSLGTATVTIGQTDLSDPGTSVDDYENVNFEVAVGPQTPPPVTLVGVTSASGTAGTATFEFSNAANRDREITAVSVQYLAMGDSVGVSGVTVTDLEDGPNAITRVGGTSVSAEEATGFHAVSPTVTISDSGTTQVQVQFDQAWAQGGLDGTDDLLVEFTIQFADGHRETYSVHLIDPGNT